MNLTSVVSRLITVGSSASRIESFHDFLSWKMEFRYIHPSNIFDESKEAAFFFSLPRTPRSILLSLIL